MPADPIRRTIKLGPAAHELRRHVGPTTWVVLEEMLQRSTGDDDHVVALLDQAPALEEQGEVGTPREAAHSRRHPAHRDSRSSRTTESTTATRSPPVCSATER